jgi:hypothetical protein
MNKIYRIRNKIHTKINKENRMINRIHKLKLKKYKELKIERKSFYLNLLLESLKERDDNQNNLI